MDPGLQPAPVDGDLIDVLRERDGRMTVVLLADGRRLRVLDIAWGYDWQDDRAHVTTNCSPGAPGLDVDVFCTSEVVAVTGEDGAVLYQP